MKAKNSFCSYPLILFSVFVLLSSCSKEPEIEYGSVTDSDGNSYNTVKIGTQEWMAENLKTTKYNDGTAIPNVTDNTAWKNSATPGFCWYNNDIINKTTYGALYKWYTVNTGKLCPSGWHVPTDEDFLTLEKYLGITPEDAGLWGWRGSDQGAQLKGTTGWDAEGNGTNRRGFSALPAGYRNYSEGAFVGVGVITYFWSSSADGSNAWYRRLDGSNKDIYRAATTKTSGKSVRCVKD